MKTETSGWKQRRVLITGATGFIGRHLTQRLVKEGADVTLFVLDEETSPPHFLPIYRGNLTNLSDIHRCVVRTQPEYVFHLASQPLVDTALKGVLDTLDSNITGGRNLLHACLDTKLKAMVYVTTDKVYGNTDNASEMDSLKGVGHPYNASKVCADVLAQMYGLVFKLPIAIVRSGNIYGGGDLNFDRIIPYACRQMIRKEPIELRSNGQYKRDYIYIDDIIDAYLLSAETAAKSRACLAINFGSEKPISVMEVVTSVLDAAGGDGEVYINDVAQNEIFHQHLNWGFAKGIGWTPKVCFEEGIRRTYQWYQEYFNDKR